MANWQERVGSVLSAQWTLEEIVARSESGCAFAARDGEGAPCTVKVLDPDLAAAGLAGEFAADLQAASRVDAEAMPRSITLDIDPDASTSFVVLEPAAGESLAARGSLGAQELLSVAEQLLDLLVRAHWVSVLERDLSPENLRVDAGGHVHLVDPTAVRFRVPRRDSVGSLEPKMPASEAEDVYELGLTLYRLATGARTSTLPRGSRPFRALELAAPTVPQEVAAFVDRALEVDLDHRYASADEMLDELLRLRRALAAREAQKRSSERSSSPRSEAPLSAPPSSDPPSTPRSRSLSWPSADADSEPPPRSVARLSVNAELRALVATLAQPDEAPCDEELPRASLPDVTDAAQLVSSEPPSPIESTTVRRERPALPAIALREAAHAAPDPLPGRANEAVVIYLPMAGATAPGGAAADFDPHASQKSVDRSVPPAPSLLARVAEPPPWRYAIITLLALGAGALIAHSASRYGAAATATAAGKASPTVAARPAAAVATASATTPVTRPPASAALPATVETKAAAAPTPESARPATPAATKPKALATTAPSPRPAAKPPPTSDDPYE